MRSECLLYIVCFLIFFYERSLMHKESKSNSLTQGQLHITPFFVEQKHHTNEGMRTAPRRTGPHVY
jgi:hypothetical protein